MIRIDEFNECEIKMDPVFWNHSFHSINRSIRVLFSIMIVKECTP
jgi:hypothetical protein